MQSTRTTLLLAKARFQWKDLRRRTSAWSEERGCLRPTPTIGARYPAKRRDRARDRRQHFSKQARDDARITLANQTAICFTARVAGSPSKLLESLMKS